MDTVVAVEDLRKTYGQRDAVQDVSFEVRRREIFGILGSNGAGKTTVVEIGSQLRSSALPERLRIMEAIKLFALFALATLARS